MSGEAAELFGDGTVLIGAKEAGAGSLLAAMMAQRGPGGRMTALLQSPADTFFAGADLERVPVGADPAEWAGLARQVLAASRPQRIVTGASAGFTIEKALIEEGRKAGVPVFTAVDHYWNLWQRFAGDSPAERWRSRPDAIYVPSPRSAERLRHQGCPVGDIRVFRHPLLEGGGVPRQPEQAAVARARLGLPDNARVVLFVSEYAFSDDDGWDWDQPADSEIVALGRELLAMVQKIDTPVRPVRLVIRPHPAESRDWNSTLSLRNSDPVRVDRALDKSAIFSVADIAVGLNSMLLAEAAGSGLPAYCRYPSGRYCGPKLSDYRSDIAEVTSLDELRDIVAGLLQKTGLRP